MALELLIISGAVQRLWTFVSFWFIIPRAFILLYLPFNISAAIFRSFQVVILIKNLAKFHLQLFVHSHHFRGSLSSFVSVLLTSTLIPGVMISVSLASLGPGVYTALLVPAWVTGEEEDYQDQCSSILTEMNTQY